MAEQHRASREDITGTARRQREVGRPASASSQHRARTRHVRMGAHQIRWDGLTQPPSSHPITRRRADPLEPGGSIVGRTKRQGFKATVLSCANGAMTDRLSQCKKLEHGLPGLNLCIRLKPFRTSHCGIASASLACPTGAFAACPAHVVYGYWSRVISASVSVYSTPTRTPASKAGARPLRSPRPFGNRRKRTGAG